MSACHAEVDSMRLIERRQMIPQRIQSPVQVLLSGRPIVGFRAVVDDEGGRQHKRVSEF